MNLQSEGVVLSLASVRWTQTGAKGCENIPRQDATSTQMPGGSDSDTEPQPMNLLNLLHLLNLNVRTHKPHDLPLGPIPVVPVLGSLDERAVTAVRRDHHRDARVSSDGLVVERRRRHERIVCGRQDQRRHADVLDHAQRAGAMVVVSGVAEAVMGGGVGLVELAHGPDARQRLQRERPRDAPPPSAASAPSGSARN